MENESAFEERLDQLAARLSVAVELFERAIPRVNAAAKGVGPIVAMVEGATAEGGREAELAQRLAEAEKTIASLRAAAQSHEGRKTLPVSLLAKQGAGTVDTGVLDAALAGLSLEQRITVKSQLIRAGLV